MNEHDYAIRDASLADAEDSYFKARPQLMRTRHEECLYEAGFKAAWDRLQAELAQLRAEKAAALEQKPVCGCIVTDFGQWPQFYREGDMTLWKLPVGNHNLYAAPTPATVPDDNLLPVLLKTSPFITCVSGDGKPKVVLQFSSLTDAQDVFCAIHNSALLRSAQSAVTAKATVPDGWSIRREGEHIVIQKSDVGGVVVKQNPSEAREIPEAILWALANDLLQSAQEPKL